MQHLFSVAAGLDSMVVGEAQILGQLRAAYSTARELGTVGTVLHEVAQHALRVGKRAQTETGIDAAGASVVTEALGDAERTLGGLAGRRALVVGTGAMGGLAAAALRRRGVGEVVLANRTPQRAERLAEITEAEGTPARAVGLDTLADRAGPRRRRRRVHRRDRLRGRRRHRPRGPLRRRPAARRVRPRPAARRRPGGRRSCRGSPWST